MNDHYVPLCRQAMGKYKGRSPTARARSDEVLEMHRGGKGPTEIAKTTGISRASVYRIINDAGSTKRRSVKPEHVEG